MKIKKMKIVQIFRHDSPAYREAIKRQSKEERQIYRDWFNKLMKVSKTVCDRCNIPLEYSCTIDYNDHYVHHLYCPKCGHSNGWINEPKYTLAHFFEEEGE